MKKLLSNIANFFSGNVVWLLILAVIALCTTFLVLGTKSEDGSITLDGKNSSYSASQEEALCNLDKQKDDAISQLLGTEVPQDAGSGCAPTDPEYAQMGASAYYDVDVSTPAAFVNAVNGRGFNEGYGLQCVAAFKEFTYALSGKIVGAAGGGAKGYATQQSQIEPLGFTWHQGTGGLQDGDWAIFGNGTYGHVAMRYQGKWFSQNQAAADANVGNAFNLLSFGTGDVIGYYRPNIYQNVATQPSQPSNPSSPSQPSQPTATSNSYTVRQGDTLGGLILNQGWWGLEGLYGDNGYAQRTATYNGIPNRGLIYPNQVIRRAE